MAPGTKEEKTTDDVEIKTHPKVGIPVTEQFKPGMNILFGKSGYRDTEYSFRELHSAPNKLEYQKHLEKIPNKLRTPEEKHNLSELKKKAIRITHNNMDTGENRVVRNEWHRMLSRNSPCPCGSGKKWKKCHMNIMRPEVPVEAYFRKPEQEEASTSQADLKPGK